MDINEFINHLENAKSVVAGIINSEEGSRTLTYEWNKVIYAIKLANEVKDSSFNGGALINLYFKLDEPRVYNDLKSRQNYADFDKAKSMFLDDLDFGLKYIPAKKENSDR